MTLSASCRTTRVSIASGNALVIELGALKVGDSLGELGGIGRDAVAADAGIV